MKKIEERTKKVREEEDIWDLSLIVNHIRTQFTEINQLS
jgi:hypothetical protein